MSRYNGKFGRVQHSGASTLKASGHPAAPAQPLSATHLIVAPQTSQTHPGFNAGGLSIPAPRITLKGGTT